MASRARTFESALPVLPLIFFCHSDPLYISFPPSPAITLALLPYLRVSYNSLWNRFIGPYEEQWIKDVTPAYALENSEQQENDQRRPENARERRAENGQREEVGNGWDGEVRLENHNIIVQGSNITNMILGALLWPSVARIVGENVLGKWPKAWGGDVVRKCLPEGVVRNVVGGLIAVVLKVCLSAEFIFGLVQLMFSFVGFDEPEKLFLEVDDPETQCFLFWITDPSYDLYVLFSLFFFFFLLFRLISGFFAHDTMRPKVYH